MKLTQRMSGTCLALVVGLLPVGMAAAGTFGGADSAGTGARNADGQPLYMDADSVMTDDGMVNPMDPVYDNKTVRRMRARHGGRGSAGSGYRGYRMHRMGGDGPRGMMRGGATGMRRMDMQRHMREMHGKRMRGMGWQSAGTGWRGGCPVCARAHTTMDSGSMGGM